MTSINDKIEDPRVYLLEDKYPYFDGNLRKLLDQVAKKYENFSLANADLITDVWRCVNNKHETSTVPTASELRKLRIKLQAGHAYENALAELTDEEAWAKVREQQKIDLEKNKKVAEKFHRLYDLKQFFSEPHCSADFSEYVNLDCWTLEEAIALSLGKNPAYVTSKTLKDIKRSIFVKEYRRRLSAMNRAIEARVICSPIKPTEFLSWATRQQMSIPNELTSAIARDKIYGQDYYEKLYALELEIKDLKEKIYLLEDLDKIKGNNRRTFYKMILGMAMARYAWDPLKTDGLNKSIADDLLGLGLEVGEGVILDRLVGAFDKLNPKINIPVPNKPHPLRFTDKKIEDKKLKQKRLDKNTA